MSFNLYNPIGPLAPPCTAVTALEELALLCGSFSVGTDRYLDMLRSSHRSASAATVGTTPVTTGLGGPMCC